MFRAMKGIKKFRIATGVRWKTRNAIFCSHLDTTSSFCHMIDKRPLESATVLYPPGCCFGSILAAHLVYRLSMRLSLTQLATLSTGCQHADNRWFFRTPRSFFRCPNQFIRWPIQAFSHTNFLA
jgi:hypothetical protein